MPPGDPPVGNKLEKCQAWLRRASKEPDGAGLNVVGRASEEFMEAGRALDEPAGRLGNLGVKDAPNSRPEPSKGPLKRVKDWPAGPFFPAPTSCGSDRAARKTVTTRWHR